jgi:hypothetical protein
MENTALPPLYLYLYLALSQSIPDYTGRLSHTWATTSIKKRRRRRRRRRRRSVVQAVHLTKTRRPSAT